MLAVVRRDTAVACPATNSCATIERGRQSLRESLALLAAQRTSGLVRNVEDVLGALADSHDLRSLDVDALAHENLGDLRQQSRAVPGDELDDRALVNGILAECDLRRRREHRSEEHTSELQSRENLVCRLLVA